MKKVKIETVNPNPKNPRVISEEMLDKLKKSITEFKEMLEIRPIIVNKENMILGGNMRYKACKELGIKEIYIEQISLSKKKEEEMIIRDNVTFGKWDWESLADKWEAKELNSWGMNVWENPLDDEDFEPESNPDFEKEQATEDDFEEGAERRIPKQKNFLECECPECKHKFEIEND